MLSIPLNSSNKTILKKIAVSTEWCKHKTRNINLLYLKHGEHNGNVNDLTDGELCCWQNLYFFHVSNRQITETDDQLLEHTILSEGGMDNP